MSVSSAPSSDRAPRAIVIHEAGDLRFDDCPASEPGPGEVRIRTAAGGICGSDLHYYKHGGFGTVRLKQPMILGHEVSGYVDALGAEVTGLELGELVAINPSRPCGTCRYCAEGLPNHCLNMRFYGSAMPFPHIQGAFAQSLVVSATQCVRGGDLSAGVAAMGEPLSVALHSVRRAGDMLGKRALVTGCGPIGVLAIVALRRAGAVEIVASDIAAKPLEHALAAGADSVVNPSSDPEVLADYARDKGYFDVLIEASGAETALHVGIAALRPRGRVVQLGLGGDMRLPMMQLTAKELALCGSFRFHEEFAIAIELMRKSLIDVAPLITHTFAFDDAVAAFEVAGDRTQAMKAQIAFASPT